jgi:hypothetical protein
MNELTLQIVEKALNIKLYEDQSQYLLNDGEYWFGGRRSGKTLVYCIKLALSEGKPLDMRKPQELCDSDYGPESNKNNYARFFFREQFLRVWSDLKDYGLKVRELKAVK